MLRRSKGFTIVELTVVIVIIGILAGLVALGWGAWQKRMAESEVKSDLNGLAASMKSYRNFNNGYPLLATGSTFDASGPSQNQAVFKASSGVKLTYFSGSSTAYCIDATSLRSSTVFYYVEVTSGGSGLVQQGTCAGGPGSVPITSGFIATDAGSNYACGVSYDYKGYCWGTGTSGQLGRGAYSSATTPGEISMSGVLSGKTIKTISTGTGHACAIASDDRAYCWGSGINGKLGNGGTSSSPSPVAVGGALASQPVKAISAGYEHTCAISTDNVAYCWGLNGGSRLGDGTTTSASSPVSVLMTGPLAGKTLTSIGTGSGQTCAIASDSNAYCWGASRLGNGTSSGSSVPVLVASTDLASRTVKQLSVGTQHNCLIASDDRAYCWGDNGSGQMGNGNTTAVTAPVAVTSGAISGKSVKAIDTGNSHVCAVATDGAGYCWGGNGNGSLGIGSTSPTTSSTSLAISMNGLSFKSVALGSSLSCAVTTTNASYCWGTNTAGQIGNGSTTSASIPTATNPIP